MGANLPTRPRKSIRAQYIGVPTRFHGVPDVPKLQRMEDEAVERAHHLAIYRAPGVARRSPSSLRGHDTRHLRRFERRYVAAIRDDETFMRVEPGQKDHHGIERGRIGAKTRIICIGRALRRRRQRGKRASGQGARALVVSSGAYYADACVLLVQIQPGRHRASRKSRQQVVRGVRPINARSNRSMESRRDRRVCCPSTISRHGAELAIWRLYHSVVHSHVV